LELEKAYNRQLARERVAIEHVNRKIKTFSYLKREIPKSTEKTRHSDNSTLRYHKPRIDNTKRLEKRSNTSDTQTLTA
jgi:hypothetical protein